MVGSYRLGVISKVILHLSDEKYVAKIRRKVIWKGSILKLSINLKDFCMKVRVCIFFIS